MLEYYCTIKGERSSRLFLFAYLRDSRVRHHRYRHATSSLLSCPIPLTGLADGPR